MLEFFTFPNFLTLGLLVMLQIVLGIDNLLYISIVSKQAPKEKQKRLRQIGISLAIIFRVLLLYLIVSLIDIFSEPIFNLDWINVIEAHFDIHSIVVLGGGAFIIYTAFKEIWHLVSHDHIGESVEERKPASSSK